MEPMTPMPMDDSSEKRWWSKNYIWAVAAAISFGFLVLFTTTSGVSYLHNGHAEQQSLGSPSKYAYCIFLSDEASEGTKSLEEDDYFVATRILLYQLLHAPEISTPYDVVVAVTNSVSQAKRARIQKDGAKVVEVEPIDAGWVHPEYERRYDSVMDKFRIWQMTQYERILILDSDIVLQVNIDGVFEEPALAKPLSRPDIKPLEHEAPYPSEYLLAGCEELAEPHHYPPQNPEDLFKGGSYINAGFMLLKPSEEVFQYYMSITKVDPKDPISGNMLFSPEWPEQELLNYVHREDGPMPWTKLDPLWMIHKGTLEDFEQKPKGIHEKFWVRPDMALQLESWKWRMDAYWDGREGNV